ncbi:MAG: outer membrane beta-barrel domain-containing protein [Deltaproteobacteria bacterium]|jgi:outer membrane immunogenic protein|nr:outer membrane beta-barrel domain-containing protein [Deltaproteobacteria bacterium]
MGNMMFNSIKIFSLVTATLVFVVTTVPASAASDFDSLGANEGIVKRARALNTKQQIQIVQKRAVDRDLRLELGIAYGGVAGGNSYLNSQPLMGALDFHITPRISVGFRYAQYANQLSKEGQSQFEIARDAQQAGQLDYTIPEIDLPKSSMMGMVSYYPMYGKLNFFDLSVVQFDLYLTGGYGQMDLKSGSTSTWTAGGGVGFWWNQYLSSRFEIRHQAYQDKVYTGTRDVGMMIGTFGIGLLL